MTTPHIHRDLIHAYAEGAKIQSSRTGDHWNNSENPAWLPNFQYRIAPEPQLPPKQPYSLDSWTAEWVRPTSASDYRYRVLAVTSDGIQISGGTYIQHLPWKGMMSGWECSDGHSFKFSPCYR